MNYFSPLTTDFILFWLVDLWLLRSCCSFQPLHFIHASFFVPWMWLSGQCSLPASSAALPQTPRSCKLVQGQPHWRKGKMARERESKGERPCASHHPYRHVVETLRGCKKRKYVFNISAPPSAHGHVTPAYASTAQAVSDMKWKPARPFLSLSNESENKSVLDELKTLSKSTLHLNQKHELCIKHASNLHGGLWWMVLRA